MNKSKLQEFWQKRGWGLPVYKVTRQDEDHKPRFKATVTVEGVTFQSQNPAKSSKAAQDEAAHLALLTFTNPPPPPPLAVHGSSNAVPNFYSNNANRSMLQLEAYQDPRVNELASVGDNNERFKDMQHLYKNALQNHARKRKLILPVYACEAEGPPHATRFRCKVTIDGKFYGSLELFPTIKEAENAAARIALASLAPNAIEEEDVSLYKNLLQELTQKAGWALPVYTTTRSGEGHSSMFFSVVVVKGEVSIGQVAKTKKQAEFLAAKVAYTKFKDFFRRGGLKGSDMSRSVIIGITTVKNILLPLSGIDVVKAALHSWLIESDNKLYQFVLMLQFTVPPAMAVGGTM